MKKIGIRSEFASGNTLVSNIFIDKYMVQASGEFVKVYLMLLRCVNDIGKEITISGLADALNHTEKDIIRALRCFEKLQVLKLRFEGEELVDIVLRDLNQQNQQENLKEARPDNLELAVSTEEVNQEDRFIVEFNESSSTTDYLEEKESFDETYIDIEDNAESEELQLQNDELQQLLFVAEQYIGSPLKQTDCDIFSYLYNELSMPSTLLEYLVEYCVTNKHNNVRYMETVALDWHKHHIKTVEQAKKYVPMSKQDIYEIMKAFGLNGRQPAPVETKWIDKWFVDDGFCLELILEACNRTITAIHNPSFKYTDKILEDWKKNGVQNIADIHNLDDLHKNKQQQMIKVTTTTVKNRFANKFHNFEQREYDYDALLRQINSTAQ